MPSISPGQLAFSAMQYLPVPTLVLNNLKTVVLANEAMGRMLGLITEDSDEEDTLPTIESLRGQTLSQVGVDILQDGQPVWATWMKWACELQQGIHDDHHSLEAMRRQPQAQCLSPRGHQAHPRVKRKTPSWKLLSPAKMATRQRLMAAITLKNRIVKYMLR
ncbi:hypothetical protein LB503_000314 [Fusarium chuoi]|nr:hypothetical protein LB503_000314 [Fusarium chuoi]